MTATIRRAVPADADVLSELGTSTFIETFGHLYSAADLQHFLDESHSPGAYAKTLANPDYALWIAERDGHAVGYAQAGPCGLPHADVRAGDGELKRLYLRQSEQNGGVGQVDGVRQLAKKSEEPACQQLGYRASIKGEDHDDDTEQRAGD